MKALIVDDAMVVRFTLKRILTEIGFTEIFEAGNGLDGIKQYREHKPDIVTMDITMPEMDGLACIREIMAIDKAAKIIVCSAMGQKAMVLEAINFGAKNFIVKPFQEDNIKATIKMVLGI